MKPTKICSIDGCERKLSASGMCTMHYKRVRKYGEPGGNEPRSPGTPKLNVGPCSVEGCDMEAKTARMCVKHYTRVRNHGDSHTLLRQPNIGLCAVEGCGQPMRSRDWCKSHYAQWLKQGEALPFKHKWGEGGYTAVHHMLRTKRGRAADLPCVDCGKVADEWSYDGECPNELIDDRGIAFTRDLSRYSPRCLPCHSAYDEWYDKVARRRLR